MLKRDLTGERFCKLVAIKHLGFINNRNSIWLCKCDCGNKAKIYLTNWGQQKSCGCLRKEVGKKNAIIIHGDSKKNKRKSLYRIWDHMKQRCNNKNNTAYKWYGGRGINYDPAWENYIEFKKQMKVKWIQAKRKYKNKVLSIERLDPNKNYCYNNCIFIPKDQQWKNTRKVQC